MVESGLLERPVSEVERDHRAVMAEVARQIVELTRLLNLLMPAFTVRITLVPRAPGIHPEP